LLPYGKVLVTGGVDASANSLTSSEIYDWVTGAWTATGAMGTFRASHTATLLPNGKVLTAGGTGGLVSAELYDPATGAWTFTGTLTYGRNLHTATLLSNGLVLVVGGLNGSSLLDTAELYAPPPANWTAAAGTWSSAGDLITARRDGHSLTLLPTGKVLVAGGYDGTSFLRNAELYDPITRTWTATGYLKVSRSYHTATLLPNGKVLVAGGLGSGYLNSAELYDPATGAWTATGAFNGGRAKHTATLLPNGLVLVAGGWMAPDSLNDAQLYDPATGAWTATGAMSTGRSLHTATLLPNGKVLVLSGSSSELYNPNDGTWSATGSPISARYFHAATLLPNGKVLVAGGYSYGSLKSAEIYDPATGTWTATGDLVTARYYNPATLLPNGKVLVAGGYDGSSYLNSAEVYDPATGTWAATGPLAKARQNHQDALLPNGLVLVAGGYNNYSPPTRAEIYGVFHTVITSVAGSGKISPSGTVAVEDGLNKTFFFTPVNSIINQVVVDGVPLSMPLPSSYTFSNVSTNHTLRVTFFPRLGGFPAIVTDKALVPVIKGTTAALRVKLNGNPGKAVSVSVTKESGSEEITITGGAEFSFDSGNWDTYQAVTLAATGDPVDLNGTAVFFLNGTGLTYKRVTARKMSGNQPGINLLLSGD
jgi:WD40 repeat protein